MLPPPPNLPRKRRPIWIISLFFFFASSKKKKDKFESLCAILVSCENRYCFGLKSSTSCTQNRILETVVQLSNSAYLGVLLLSIPFSLFKTHVNLLKVLYFLSGKNLRYILCYGIPMPHSAIKKRIKALSEWWAHCCANVSRFKAFHCNSQLCFSIERTRFTELRVTCVYF